jgi:hypothetical protein
MTRTPALAAAAAVLLLTTGAAARADSGGNDPAAPMEMGTQMQHGTHQMPDGTQMEMGTQMQQGTHQMPDGTQMDSGAPMQHGTHQMPDGTQMEMGTQMQHGPHHAGMTSAAARPRVLTLGGFALVNVIVLAVAALVRHRDRRRPARGSVVAGGAR